jgi:hypothetical protein
MPEWDFIMLVGLCEYVDVTTFPSLNLEPVQYRLSRELNTFEINIYIIILVTSSAFISLLQPYDGSNIGDEEVTRAHMK